MLNEAGRYLQAGSFIGSFVENETFVEAAGCYEEAYEQFRRRGDVVNGSVVLGNYAKLLRKPLEVGTAGICDLDDAYSLEGRGVGTIPNAALAQRGNRFRAFCVLRRCDQTNSSCLHPDLL